MASVPRGPLLHYFDTTLPTFSLQGVLPTPHSRGSLVAHQPLAIGPEHNRLDVAIIALQLGNLVIAAVLEPIRLPTAIGPFNPPLAIGPPAHIRHCFLLVLIRVLRLLEPSRRTTVAEPAAAAWTLLLEL